MSRQLEQHKEDAARRRHEAIVRAIEFEMDSAISSSGHTLLGFSAKLSSGDCLITIRAVRGGSRQICFVGGSDLGSAIIKCVREGRVDKLNWREDRYGG